MKKINKGVELRALKTYKRKNPDELDNWKSFRDHPSGIYLSVKNKKILNQQSICAYCESQLKDAAFVRLEHAKDKKRNELEDSLVLDWNNLLGVCFGNETSNDPLEEKSHLHCDAYKNHLKNKKENIYFDKLLNPHFIPNKTKIFELDKTNGNLIVNYQNCRGVPYNGFDLAEAAEYTIRILNLNCSVLTTMRKSLVNVYARKRKEAMDKRTEFPISILLANWFSLERLEFFTTKRCIFGKRADDYLKTNNYSNY